MVINFKDINVNRSIIALLAISIVVLLFSFFSASEYTSLFKGFAFPYALLVYTFIHNTLNKDLIPSIRVYIFIYLAVVFLQYFSPPTYVALFSEMVREIKITELGGVRGVSALTTEPSFTALILFVFIVLVRHTKIFQSALLSWGVILMLCFGIFTTKAITGVAFVGLFLLLEVVKRVELGKLVFVGAVFVFLSFLDLESYRGLNFMMTLLKSPEIILYESSFFYRVYYFTYGFMSLAFNPLGIVFGTVDPLEIKAATDALFYGYTFPHLFERTLPGITMPSALAIGLMAYGYIYLFFYSIIFVPTYLNFQTPLIVRILIMAFTAQSFSFGFPLVWFLLVMSEKKYWGNFELKNINNKQIFESIEKENT